MPILTVQFNSDALESEATFTAFLPNPKIVPPPYKVLVQLHGKYDAHTAWLYKSKLMIYTRDYPMIVIMPDGGNHWWADVDRLHRYESLIVNDLRAFVPSVFPVDPDARWAIGGLSMGGYGAIAIGLGHPYKFGSIYAHSSALLDADMAEAWTGVSKPVAEMMDNYKRALACIALPQADWPRLSFDCGVEDGLLPLNQSFSTWLKAKGYPHTYQEFPGSHTWEYWDAHVPAAIGQHAAVWGIEPIVAQG